MKKLNLIFTLRQWFLILLPVCLFLCSAIGYAQNTGRVSGTVVDKTGEPLIGVSIAAKGTQSGTITDVNGKYTLDVPSNATLTFSYLGYQSTEMPVSGRSTIDVTLSEDAKLLDEVVVVGYGSMRKKDLTGSIVQIRPDNLAAENPKTVQDILRGTPGLAVSYDATAKGGGSMQLRGQRSVYTDGNHNEPLIILDGMIFYGELSEINPDDIGQIDILKDASAAAIYGARAASGVIIITTKKGNVGKPVVNISTNIGFTQRSDYREVFGPNEYIKHREDWYKTPTLDLNSATGKYEYYRLGRTDVGYFDNPSNLAQYGITADQWRGYSINPAGTSDNQIYASNRLGMDYRVLENYLAGKAFNWYDHTFQTGVNHDHNASVSGANDKMTYYLSMGYQKNEGAVTGNQYQAIRSNMKVEGKVNSWLEIGANINFQNRSRGDIQPGLGLNYYNENQLRNSPYSFPTDENGELLRYPMGDGFAMKSINFDFEKQYYDLESGYTIFNSIFNVKIKLPFNISYQFNASPRYQFYYDRYHESSENPRWTSTNGLVNREQSYRFDWSLNNIINWDKTFANKHQINVTLVQEAEARSSWLDRIEARNILPSDVLGFHNTANGEKANSSYRSSDTRQTADALLARAFYSYDDKYMLTASIRRDGYSAFGQLNPYATFPSLAAAWTFTNENFFTWEPMNHGKLRLSWGKNGNRSLDDPYVSLANLTTSTGTGARDAGMYSYVTNAGATQLMRALVLSRLANPNLQWEKTASWNAGLDFGFLKNRISGTIEAYSMSTNDMIMTQNLPEFAGPLNIVTNLGEVTNKGIELSLNTVNIRKQNLEWRTTFNISYNQNRIKHLYYIYEDVFDAQGNVIGRRESDYTPNTWFIGQPISVIWNYNVTGIWQVNEYNEVRGQGLGQWPGDPKVKNNPANDKQNADGTTTIVYNDDDKEFLGQTTPPINISLRNDFTLFKDWTVSFNMYSRWGHKSVSGNYLNRDNDGNLFVNNMNTWAKDYWLPENPTNEFARLNATGPNGASSPSKLYDRSFIRLESISIGYSLPKKLISRFDVEKARIFGSVRNVAVWTKDWPYGDPETQGNNDNGLGGLATRVFSFGLNVTF